MHNTAHEVLHRLALVGFCTVVLFLGLGPRAPDAQEVAPGVVNAGHQMLTVVNPEPQKAGIVGGHSRTAASYGHAFVWYGRTDQREVEVAGLHPASDSAIPYVIGHLLPVPAETGASYGDLDEQYLTAHYRVYLREPYAQKVFAYIKRL